MLILLEGPDCSGKSTLAGSLTAAIAARYPGDEVTLLHRSSPTRHPLHEYVEPLLEYRPNSGQHIVCDRWHLGEVIYPRVMNRKTDMSTGVWWWTERFLESRGALTVIINPPTSILLSRFDARGDASVKRHQLEAISAAYATHIQWQHRHFDHSPTVDDVLAMAEGRETYVPPAYVTYIGPALPKALLVGDVRADLEILGTQGPAFAPFPLTSGLYLTNTVADMHHVGVANACDVDNIAVMWYDLGQPTLVALGKAADTTLKQLGMAHGAVPHPQYMRRFHYKHMGWYRNLINSAITSERDLLICRPS
jgi:thymidylate kinase